MVERKIIIRICRGAGQEDEMFGEIAVADGAYIDVLCSKPGVYSPSGIEVADGVVSFTDKNGVPFTGPRIRLNVRDDR